MTPSNEPGFCQDYLAYTKEPPERPIDYPCGIDWPKICPVRSVMQLVLQAKWLNQPDDMPDTVYKTKKGRVIYLTGNKIAELLRKAVKEVRPDTTPDKLNSLSAMDGCDHPL